MIDKNYEHGVFPFIGEMGGNFNFPTVSVIISTLTDFVKGSRFLQGSGTDDVEFHRRWATGVC